VFFEAGGPGKRGEEDDEELVKKEFSVLMML